MSLVVDVCDGPELGLNDLQFRQVAAQQVSVSVKLSPSASRSGRWTYMCWGIVTVPRKSRRHACMESHVRTSRSFCDTAPHRCQKRCCNQMDESGSCRASPNSPGRQACLWRSSFRRCSFASPPKRSGWIRNTWAVYTGLYHLRTEIVCKDKRKIIESSSCPWNDLC